jgi:hypothetical protein
MMSGRCGIYSAILPFNPIYAGLDLAEKISDAILADNINISATGIFTLVNGGMTLNVSTISDSAFIRVEHNYAPPDQFKTTVPTLHISDYHYWKVDGIIPSGFDATATIGYNGSFSTSGYVDNNLITNTEDSLVVLYRSSPQYDWTILTDITHSFLGSHTDKMGNFTINHLQKGEYAFGTYDYDKIDSSSNTGSEPCILLTVPSVEQQKEDGLIVYPNPANESVTVIVSVPEANHLLQVYDSYGHLIYYDRIMRGESEKNISVNTWPGGAYFFRLYDKEHNKVESKTVIIK